MAYEIRNGGSRYYYRSKRVNGRVTKVYCGTGLIAELAADEDRVRRAQRRELLKRRNETQEQIDCVARPIEEFMCICDKVMEAALLVAGFHYHRGEWRRRGKRKKKAS